MIMSKTAWKKKELYDLPGFSIFFRDNAILYRYCNVFKLNPKRKAKWRTYVLFLYKNNKLFLDLLGWVLLFTSRFFSLIYGTSVFTIKFFLLQTNRISQLFCHKSPFPCNAIFRIENLKMLILVVQEHEVHFIPNHYRWKWPEVVCFWNLCTIYVIKNQNMIHATYATTITLQLLFVAPHLIQIF